MGDDNNNGGLSLLALMLLQQRLNQQQTPPTPTPTPTYIPSARPQANNTTYNNPATQAQPATPPLTKEDIARVEAARADYESRRVFTPGFTKFLTFAFVGGVAATVIGFSSDKIMGKIGQIPGLEHSFESTTNPAAAKLRNADIKFAPMDDPYTVSKQKACLHTTPNDYSLTDICFERGHKIQGQILYPFDKDTKPTWLAVQVRHNNGEKIIGNAYLPLEKLRSDPIIEAAAAPLPVPPAAKAHKAPANNLKP
jgi:hypothetical protein